MYGLIAIDHWREVVFDDAGQSRIYDRGTGAVSLCDLEIDGTFYCYGSQETDGENVPRPHEIATGIDQAARHVEGAQSQWAARQLARLAITGPSACASSTAQTTNAPRNETNRPRSRGAGAGAGAGQGARRRPRLVHALLTYH
jgi:hypothetical protein